MKDIQKNVTELQNAFPGITVEHFNQGGVDFYKMKGLKMIPGEECLFQVGTFLGYPSRLFFPAVLRTSQGRNWNHKNILIGDRKYCAFSYQVKPGSVLEMFLAHLGGIR